MSDPGNPIKRTDYKVLAQFLVLAVVLHLAAWPLLDLILPKPEPFDPSKANTRKIRLVRAPASSKVPRIKLPKRKEEKTEEEKEELAKKEKQEEKPDWDPKSIVDVPPMESDEAPEDAELASEYNTKVERETISRNRRPPDGYITNEAMRTKNGVDVKVRDETMRVTASNGLEDQKETAKKQELQSPEQSAKDRLALNVDPMGRFKNQKAKESLLGEGKQLKLSLDGDSDSDEKGSRASSPVISNTNDLIPSIGVLAKIAGAPMNDHVEGIDEGEGTFLNTREFKYASFFNRMKRGIAQHWNPTPEVRRRDPTGNIYGIRRRTTVLEVTLNADGALEKVDVQQSCGLDFLDQVAVSAMRSAQPFPNPPKGMMDENGNIVFGFGFTLDFSGRGVRLPF